MASERWLTVFCGSNRGTSPAYVETVRELGRSMAQRQVGLVYGGARVGLMGELADAVLAAGGEVVGVMPGHLVEHEVAHTGLTRLEVTATMHERKTRMVELADGVIALPGGYGTFEELLEVLTWNQLGLVSLPVVLLDIEGFYTPLLELLDRAVDTGFVRPAHRALAQRADRVEAALDLALAGAVTPTGPDTHKWLDLDRA